MSNATIRSSVVGSLVIVALAVTVWSAVAQAGPTPIPTATPTPKPAREATFMGLQSLRSTALAISSDGSVVVGKIDPGPGDPKVYRWDWEKDSLAFLETVPRSSQPLGISADGSVIVGGGDPTSIGIAWRWENGVVSQLGILPGQPLATASIANGTSADGSVLVGTSGVDAGTPDRAFRWEGGTMTALSPEYTQALGVSADGSVVVGYVCSPSVCEAFRWTTETGVVRLGFLSGPNSIARAVSADGSVVVGESGWAFRWKSGVMMDLGALPGSHASRAMAVSADGSVVVGRNWVTARSSVAFIWSATTGLRNLRDVLIDDFGLDLTGWTLFQARGISADGRVIVGDGRDPLGRGQGWVAVLPKLGADCLCEVQNINPNQVVLQNVGTGGKGANSTRKMVMTLNAVDAPGATCDPGEFSAPTLINLKMEDDRGNLLINSAKTVVCEQGVTINLKRNAFFRGPLNCENGAVPPPKPDFSLGTITSTGSAPGTADYVESIRIKCFE